METMVLPETNQKEQDMFRTISLTALLVGTLDITAANVQFYLNTNHGAKLKLNGAEEPVSFITYLTHGGPDRIFKYISKAVFDPATNEKLLIAWGAVFHYLIAFSFTVVLFLLYPKISKLIRNKFLVGFIYGLFIWSIMNLLVVPMSKINKFPANLKQAAIAELILTFMIGLPVALIANSYYKRKRAT